MLAVTHQADNPVVHFFGLQGQSHSDSGRQPLAEVTGVPLNPRRDKFHMSGKAGAGSSETG